MPEFTTHYLFGKHIANQFSPDIVRIIKSNYAAFNWGLQGPDLLFYSNVVLDGGRTLKAGVALHHKSPSEIFPVLLEFILRYKNEPEYEILCSYFYGFICHYALDSTVHPYVYSLIHKLDGEITSTRHITIESEIGSLFYQADTGEPISSFDIDMCYDKFGDYIKPVTEMYIYLIQNLYGKTLHKKKVENCFSFCIFLSRFTYLFACEQSDSKIKTVLIKGSLAVIKIWPFVNSFVKHDSVEHDTLNLQHETWSNLNDPDQVFSQSFHDLFDQAVLKALQLSRTCKDMLETEIIVPLEVFEAFDNGEPVKRVRLKPENRRLLKILKSRA